MVKRYWFWIAFVLTTVIVLAINLSGWRKGDWRVEWSCAAVLVAILGWAAVRFAGHTPQTGELGKPLWGLRVKVMVWDIPESYRNIREGTARALQDLLAADGANVEVSGRKDSPVHELEVLDVALERRAGSASLTGGRDSPQDRYSMTIRLIGPDAHAAGTRAIYVDVAPSASAEDIGKRLAYNTTRRLAVFRTVEGTPRLAWRDRVRRRN